MDRLARQGLLTRDPLIQDALQGNAPLIASRTLRYRFLRATGYTQGGIRQYERACKAAALLEQGRPVLDTVFEAGLFRPAAPDPLAEALARAYPGADPAGRASRIGIAVPYKTAGCRGMMIKENTNRPRRKH